MDDNFDLHPTKMFGENPPHWRENNFNKIRPNLQKASLGNPPNEPNGI